MCALETVNGNTPPLRSLFFDFVKSCSDSSMSVWDMAEITSNLVGPLRDCEGEWIIVGICDENGIFVIAGGSKACDN